MEKKVLLFKRQDRYCYSYLPCVTRYSPNGALLNEVPEMYYVNDPQYFDLNLLWLLGAVISARDIVICKSVMHTLGNQHPIMVQ